VTASTLPALLLLLLLVLLLELLLVHWCKCGQHG
jgi:hypothetical protein